MGMVCKTTQSGRDIQDDIEYQSRDFRPCLALLIVLAQGMCTMQERLKRSWKLGYTILYPNPVL